MRAPLKRDMGRPDTHSMDAAAVLSPDLVLVLPPEERRRAIAALPAAGPPAYLASPRIAGPPAIVAAEPFAPTIVHRAVLRYAIYKSVVAAAWYVVFALVIGLVVAALAVR